MLDVGRALTCKNGATLRHRAVAWVRSGYVAELLAWEKIRVSSDLRVSRDSRHGSTLDGKDEEDDQ